jgi:hypothetical protein
VTKVDRRGVGGGAGRGGGYGTAVNANALAHHLYKGYSNSGENIQGYRIAGGGTILKVNGS